MIYYVVQEIKLLERRHLVTLFILAHLARYNTVRSGGNGIGAAHVHAIELSHVQHDGKGVGIGIVEYVVDAAWHEHHARISTRIRHSTRPRSLP